MDKTTPICQSLDIFISFHALLQISRNNLVHSISILFSIPTVMPSCPGIFPFFVLSLLLWLLHLMLFCFRLLLYWTYCHFFHLEVLGNIPSIFGWFHYLVFGLPFIYIYFILLRYFHHLLVFSIICRIIFDFPCCLCLIYLASKIFPAFFFCSSHYYYCSLFFIFVIITFC